MEGKVRSVPPSHWGGVVKCENFKYLDQEVVDGADLVIVHPLPQHEHEGAGDERRDKQHDPVESRQFRLLDPVDENRQQQGEDDGAGQKHRRE